MKIEIGKLYKTADGKKVKIYDNNVDSQLKIHGAICFKNDSREEWIVSGWLDGGKRYALKEYEIVSEWTE